MKKFLIASLAVLALIVGWKVYAHTQTSEVRCVFDPPGTTNAINMPCYADLHAVAYDDQGNSASSDPVRVHFADVTPPTVYVFYPTEGSTVSGTVPVVTSVTDDYKIATIYLLVDDLVVAENHVSPYGFTLDTTTLVNGSHSLFIRAWDSFGHAGDSALVHFVVANATPTPTPTPEPTSTPTPEPTSTPTPLPSPSPSPSPSPTPTCSTRLPNGKCKKGCVCH